MVEWEKNVQQDKKDQNDQKDKNDQGKSLMNEKKAKILVVEDDHDICDIMTMQLEAQDYLVQTASTGLEAQELLQGPEQFSLIILDWMLPGPSGIELCQFVRQSEKSQTPILIVTAKEGPEFIVDALDSGADDFIAKPFSMEIFLARVRALLRRNLFQNQASSAEGLVEHGPITINETKHEVFIQSQQIQLTISEFKILKTLMLSPGHVFTRKQLIENIGGPGFHVGGRTIDTQLVGLRKKLGDQAASIETIRGIGYRFRS